MADSMDSSKPAYSLVKIVVYMLCILGFSLNIVVTSCRYFKYITVPLYAPYIPFEQQLPYVSFCGMIDSRNNSDQAVCSSRVIGPSEVIKNCQLRNFTSRRMENISCEDGFIVTQAFRKSTYKCFTITARNNLNYGILEAIAVSRDARVLYSFRLLPLDLPAAGEKIMMAHVKPSLEGEYRNAKQFPISDQAQSMSIEIAYELFEWRALPSPYTTNCIEASVCLNSCGERHPWCNNIICSDNITNTYSREKTFGQGVNIILETLASPSTRIEYIPVQTPSAFILEILTLLGIWLALSVQLVAKTLSRHFKASSSIHPAQPMDSFSLHRRIMYLSRKAGLDSTTIKSIMAIKSTSKQEEYRSLSWVAKYFFQLLIVSIFLREISLISMDYFKYKTRSNIELYRYGVIDKYPAVTHCLDVNNWFNRIEAKFRYEGFDREMTRFSESFNLTLKQVFDATPHEQSVIKGCNLPNNTSSSTNCNDFFSVRKIYFGEFICYHFEPLIDFIPLEKLESESSSIFTIQLDDSLTRIPHFQSIVSYGLPYYSRFLVPEGWKQTPFVKLELGYQLFKYELLPWPYSHCSQSVEIGNCMLDCWNSFKFKRLPFASIIDRPIDLPVLNYVGMKNELLALEVDEAQNTCEYRCPLKCHDSVTSSRVSIKQSNESLQLNLLFPDFPILFSHAVAVYSIYDYIYQVLCSASFWFGFSFISLLHQLKMIKSFVTGHRVVDHSAKLGRMVIELEKVIRSKFRCLNVITKPAHQTKSRFRLLKRIKLSLITVPIIIGFTVHMSLTVNDYFQYATAQDTTLKVEDNFTDLRWHICIRLDQLGLSGDFSLAEIWNNSPREDEVIRECGYRGADLASLSHLPRLLRRRLLPFINSTSLCHSFMKVKKYFTLGLICYEVRPVAEAMDTEYRLQHQIALNRVYGYVILTPTVSRFYLTLSTSQGPSFMSSILPSTPDHIAVNSTSKYIFITYSKFIISSLPYPYNMGVYASLKRLNCVRACVHQRLKKFGLWSSYGATFHIMPLHHETNITQSSQIRERCKSGCKVKRHFLFAEDVYFDTFSRGPYESIDFCHLTGSLGLWYYTSNDMVARTTFLPQFRLVDLVLFSGSIFSIWFGFSALHVIDLAFNKVKNNRSSRGKENLLRRTCDIHKMIASGSRLSSEST